MEILDLLALIFCVLAVVLNAAACFVLLKRKTGKGAPAYPFVFAALSFVFLILGCVGYLLSGDVIATLATIAASGLCSIVYCATEKPPARPEGEAADFGLLMTGSDESGADDGLGIDLDSLLSEYSPISDDDFSGEATGFSGDDLGIDFDSLLKEGSGDDLGIDFDSLFKESSGPDGAPIFSVDDLGIDFDSLLKEGSDDDLGIDFDSLFKESSGPDGAPVFSEDDLGIDFDTLLAQSSGQQNDDFSAEADGAPIFSDDDLGIDFDTLLAQSSGQQNDDFSGDALGFSDDDLGIDFDTLLAQSSGQQNDDFSDEALGFSDDDLDDFGIDFDLDDDFDMVFPPEEDFDAEFLQDAEDGAPADEPLLDEAFEADFPQGDEALLPAPAALEEDAALGGDLDADDVDSILKAGQELVASVAESMRGEASMESLLDFANRSLMERAGADGGIIFLVDEDGGGLAAKAFGGQFAPPYKLPNDVLGDESAVQDALRHARLPFEGNIFGEAALSGEALCIEDGESDARVYQNGSGEFLTVGSYIIAPLSVKDKVVGVAGLARPPQREPFSQKDFKAAKAIAGYVAAMIGNVYSFKELVGRAELKTGVEMASKMQETFLPKNLPDLPSAGFGFFFEGAEGACADYCDVIFARRDRIALVMADVDGEGIASVMIMTALRALLHLVTNTTQSASTILDWVNKSIADKNIDMDRRVAISYVLYSPETNEVDFASAGGMPMLLWRSAEKKVETVDIESDPLGIDRGSEYKEKKLTVAAGDVIILCTDGLVETLNEQGARYGVEELSRVVAENNGVSAKDIAAAVRHDLQSFIGAGAPRDDRTLLVMKIENP